jgi:putative aldouronate transport system permease protein
MAFVIFLTLYPFWNLVVISLNDPKDSLRGDLYFFPRIFTSISYETIIKHNKDLMTAISNSFTRTILGTILNVSCSTLVAYALSRKEFVLRKFLNKYLIMTMYLMAGLIPTYLLYLNLGLIDNYAVYLLPHLLSAYNIILVRTFMEGIPSGLSEAATIDGASESQLLTKVILPLCKPVIATVALFIAVFQWSSWQDTFFYASNPQVGLTTLQFEMMKIVRSSTASLTDAQLVDASAAGRTFATPQSLQAAMTIVATIPILVVYPFVQKYFVSGVTLGAIKE